MNPIGIQYLYWNDIPLEEALDLTAAAGADVFECGTAVIHAMPPERRREFGALVRSRGLTLTLNGGMPGSDLCSPDEELRRRSIQLSQEAIQAAADAGSAVWGGIIYSKWLAIPSQSLTRQARQEMWDRGIASLRQVLPAAEQYPCGSTRKPSVPSASRMSRQCLAASSCRMAFLFSAMKS